MDVQKMQKPTFEFAVRNASGGDWFRHDATNGEASPRVQSRTGASRPGCEVVWYNHSSNQNYVPPRSKSRLLSQDSNEIKGGDWYKHENNFSTPRTSPRCGSATAKENKALIRHEGTPLWALPNTDTNDEVLSTKRSHHQNGVSSQEEIISPRKGQGLYAINGTKDSHWVQQNGDSPRSLSPPRMSPRSNLQSSPEPDTPMRRHKRISNEGARNAAKFKGSEIRDVFNHDQF